MIDAAAHCGESLHLPAVRAADMAGDDLPLGQGCFEQTQHPLVLIDDRGVRRLIESVATFPIKHVVQVRNAHGLRGFQAEHAVLQIGRRGSKKDQANFETVGRTLEGAHRVSAADNRFPVEAVRGPGNAVAQQ
jgi:hypothetical protein